MLVAPFPLSNINKLKKFLQKCCLSPVHHAMFSHSPRGSAEPFTTFLTFFMPSITPEVVTLEKKETTSEFELLTPILPTAHAFPARIKQHFSQVTLYPELPVLMFCLSYCYHFADQVSSWTHHWWVLGAMLLSSRLSSAVTKLEQTYVGWLTVSCSDQVSQHWERANPLCLAMGNTEVPTALVCQDLL